MTQEQNTPVQTTLANLLQEGHIFLSINLKLLKKNEHCSSPSRPNKSFHARYYHPNAVILENQRTRELFHRVRNST